MSEELGSPANLLVIVGPTGSGKSNLGLALAGVFDGEIVSCDSVQIYRQLDIGSAKTPKGDRRGVRHHLIDVANVDEHFTAGDYQRQSRQAIASIRARGRLPLVVGGTGFYLRALLEGLSTAPQRDETARKRMGRIAAKRPGTLHRMLAAKDPMTAARIHPNDQQKLIRALEMIAVSGEAASTLQKRPREPLTGFRVTKIGLSPPRTALYERLNARCILMFKHGLIEETARLLADGFPAESKALHSLGYKQAIAVLGGAMDTASAIDECQIRTRQYAKRQLTWFRNDPDIHWLSGFGEGESLQKEAIVFLRGRLNLL